MPSETDVNLGYGVLSQIYCHNFSIIKKVEFFGEFRIFWKFEFFVCLNFLKFKLDKLSNAESSRKFHKSIQKRFPTPPISNK